MWGDKMGHSGEVIVGDNFVTNVGINKNFLKNQLNVNLTFRNIFKTSRQNMEAHIGNVDFYKWNGNDHFGVRFQVSYNFNSASSKYKGKGAAEEERRIL